MRSVPREIVNLRQQQYVMRDAQKEQSFNDDLPFYYSYLDRKRNRELTVHYRNETQEDGSTKRVGHLALIGKSILTYEDPLKAFKGICGGVGRPYEEWHWSYAVERQSKKEAEYAMKRASRMPKKVIKDQKNGAVNRAARAAWCAKQRKEQGDV